MRDFAKVADNGCRGCSRVVEICRREEGPFQTYRSLNFYAGGVTADRDERCTLKNAPLQSLRLFDVHQDGLTANPQCVPPGRFHARGKVEYGRLVLGPAPFTCCHPAVHLQRHVAAVHEGPGDGGFDWERLTRPRLCGHNLQLFPDEVAQDIPTADLKLWRCSAYGPSGYPGSKLPGFAG